MVPTNSFSAMSADAVAEISPVALERLRRQHAFARKHRARFAQLTRREREILALIARGMTNEAIAASLYRSVHTVRTHRNNIWRQLGITTVVEAVWWSEAFDLI